MQPKHVSQEPIQTGIDLQKYIEEEIEKSKKQSDKAEVRPAQRKSYTYPTNVNEALYFDVPIKIEENGEGFTPPSQIRYVSLNVVCICEIICYHFYYCQENICSRR